MSEHETDNGEELIDEQGRNATQQEIDGDREGPASTGGGDPGGWDEPNDEPADNGDEEAV
jgi:hypothetical protein